MRPFLEGMPSLNRRPSLDRRLPPDKSPSLDIPSGLKVVSAHKAPWREVLPDEKHPCSLSSSLLWRKETLSGQEASLDRSPLLKKTPSRNEFLPRYRSSL